MTPTINSEHLDILDHNYRPVGKSKARDDIHKDGDIHGSVHAWIIDSDKNVLLQKRTMKKKLFPGRWCPPISGHISSGTDYMTTLVEEASEELGIEIDTEDYVLLGIIRDGYENKELGIFENEFVHVFVTHNVPADLDLDIENEEVAEIRWLSLEEFRTMVKEKPEQLITFFTEFELILNYLDKK